MAKFDIAAPTGRRGTHRDNRNRATQHAAAAPRDQRSAALAGATASANVDADALACRQARGRKALTLLQGNLRGSCPNIERVVTDLSAGLGSPRSLTRRDLRRLRFSMRRHS